MFWTKSKVMMYKIHVMNSQVNYIRQRLSLHKPLAEAL